MDMFDKMVTYLYHAEHKKKLMRIFLKNLFGNLLEYILRVEYKNKNILIRSQLSFR